MRWLHFLQALREARRNRVVWAATDSLISANDMPHVELADILVSEEGIFAMEARADEGRVLLQAHDACSSNCDGSDRRRFITSRRGRTAFKVLCFSSGVCMILAREHYMTQAPGRRDTATWRSVIEATCAGSSWPWISSWTVSVCAPRHDGSSG